MKIIDKQVLADVAGTRTTRLKVLAPHIAVKAKAGQFVVVMASEKGERVPLTIVDRDTSTGSITLIFQEVGLTTKLLGKLTKGDSLFAGVGPLGHSTELKNYGSVILIGGGVGIAEIFPVAKTLQNAGNSVTTILGARTKELIILEDEIKAVSKDVHVATDDGTYGRKGFTTDVLGELLEKKKYSFIYAVGPIPMMRKVADVTRDTGVKTVVSLNALMVDATGMCGCCRVTVNGELKFSCVDGPEFDAHAVDWVELTARNSMYGAKEKHICKMLLKIGAR